MEYGSMNYGSGKRCKRQSIIQSKGWREKHSIFWRKNLAHIVKTLGVVEYGGSVDWKVICVSSKKQNHENDKPDHGVEMSMSWCQQRIKEISRNISGNYQRLTV
ncbi:hypothetical protein M7I_3031 [Glarea lozoyensis 74030]|uniref:Uncharacterized protein n=1 Tax=Glarea lozoyensis (strain ATCC 74030 / MF5533) TaxID=1104152 RepID=H0EKD4_GLAL7|nr:hypothetical protein M7I_3031 [Glarea lozoyensis 74030]